MHVLCVGTFEPHDREALRLALSRAGASSDTLEPGAARAVLSSATASVPTAVIANLASASVADFVGWLRGEARYFSVAVVGIVPHAADQAFVEAFSAGADDVVAHGELGALTRRIAALEGFDPAKRGEPTRGHAVVADPDEGSRRVLGRLIRRAGFDVGFASSVAELLSGCGALPALDLAVLDERIEPRGAFDAIDALRAARGGAEVPCIILTPGSLTEAASRAAAYPSVAVGSELAPSDNLLFLANEVTRGDFSELRRSTRLLYSTLCTFRRAGDLVPGHGLTYNLSRDGLYVRTLDPPPRGSEVWIELRPPRGALAVHLRATVVWTLHVSAPALPAPPGFGARIEEGHCAERDLLDYRGGYDQLRAQPRLIG